MEIDKETLEDVLKKIDELGEDLSAEIVYQEEEGYMTKEEYSTDSKHRSSSSKKIDVWVVEQERIAEPDIEKRRAAEKELTEIFEGGSPWYSARYKAGLYLMPFDGYNLGRIINEEARIAERFAQDFRFLKGVVENKDSLKKMNQDFDALYNMVRFKHIRKEMCRIMGYSYFRFIAKEHPIAAKVAGITAAVGAVSGLVYGLIGG